MDNKNVTRELPFEGIWQITNPIKNDVQTVLKNAKKHNQVANPPGCTSRLDTQ